MTSSSRCGTAVAVFVLLVARVAAGGDGGSSTGKSGGVAAEPAEVRDTPTHLVRGAACVTAAGAALVLRADTTILEPGQWEALDASLRASETAETRLAAENRSLRASAQGSRWGSVWPVLAAFATGAGISAAVVAYELK